MSEKEVTEEQITDTLNEIMESNPDHTIKFLAKIIFNLRFDLDELKIEILKTLKGIEPEGEPEPEELKYPPDLPTKPERFYNDFYK